MPDARSNELVGQCAPQRAAANEHRTRACQRGLRSRADLREQNLSMISVHFIGWRNDLRGIASLASA